MALMLAGGQWTKTGLTRAKSESSRRSSVGYSRTIQLRKPRPRATRRGAKCGKGKSRELPPLDFGHSKRIIRNRAASRSRKHAQTGAHHPTPAEEAAAGMDPIEDLISQIMEPSSHTRPNTGAPPPPRSSQPPAKPKPDAISPNVPLRELVLAWYESRGYRGSPASPAVWPIELVLRHRGDAARAYAFVVQNDHVSVDRITALIEQAREIGMMRVAVVAEAGYESGAKELQARHVRLIDRPAMEAELAELELPTAAKSLRLLASALPPNHRPLNASCCSRSPSACAPALRAWRAFSQAPWFEYRIPRA